MATAAASAGGAVDEAGPALRFEDIESAFGEADRLSAAEAAIAAVVPMGTPLPEAQATLERAGTRCRPQRRHPEVIECVYAHRITVADYYPADIIWTTLLHGDGARVTRISISREIDKH